MVKLINRNGVVLIDDWNKIFLKQGSDCIKRMLTANRISKDVAGKENLCVAVTATRILIF